MSSTISEGRSSPSNKMDIGTSGGGEKRCANCQETFPCEATLKVHIHEHSLPNVQQISFSNNFFPRAPTKNRLLSINYDCQICETKYSSKELLIQHVNGHLEGHTCKNKSCLQIYGSLYETDKDQKLTEQDNFSQRDRKNCLKQNRTEKTNTLKISFDKDDFSLSRKNSKSLNTQIRNSEFNFSLRYFNDDGKITKRKRATYQCTICKKFLSSKLSHDEHYRKHSGEKPYNCSICSKKYAVKNTFRQHMAAHVQQSKSSSGGQTPEKCSICSETLGGGSGSRSGDFEGQNHICPPVNKRGESFRCKICHKVFARREWRTKHYLEHDGGESCFRCEICGDIFPDEQFYLIHAQNHNNEICGKRSFLNCPVCAKMFPSKELYERHSCRFGAVISSG